MSRAELLEGLELFYMGQAFTGFREDNPFVTFLRFDRDSWSAIWVKYAGRMIRTTLENVKLKCEENIA